MEEKEGYSIEYQGGYSSLDPEKAYSTNFAGYRASGGDFGITTDPRTANIIKEVSGKLSAGVKQIELTMVTPRIFDAVPQQQLKETKQLAELTGIDVSIHGPVIDTAGISQQGFDELNREASERVIANTLDRSHEVNPNGNVNVTFHTSEGIPGSEWKTLGEKGKEREFKKMIAINKETGQMVPLKEDIKYYPDMEELKEGVEEKIKRGIITKKQILKSPEKYYKEIPLSEGKPYSPEENLRIANNSDWDNKISQLFFNKERVDEILNQNYAQIQHLMKDIQEKNLDPSKDLTPTQQEIWMKYGDAKNYLDELNRTANNLFSKAYEFGDPRQREKLIELNEQYKKDLGKNGGTVVGQSKAMHRLLNELQDSQNNLAPKMFVPIEDFAVEQSSKTFGNAAFAAYKKFKDKTPIISIENPPIGHALSTGEDLRNLVIASRKQFAEKLIAEEGMNKNQAEKTAEKLIGATWDLGHINMLRKQGFESKDIVKESEKIRPFVKHVHLSDNFGLEHTELPMGMGNVPTKEIMEKLGKEGFEAKKIIEAGDWWQHMQTNPVKEVFEGFSAPVYSVGGMPYWNQTIGFHQDYSEGYGMMLPSINYQTFGAGFSQLPREVGGQLPGQGNRMSGRPME